MGCDIHLYVEVKRDGEWQHHDWRTKHSTDETYSDGTPKKNYDTYFKDPLYVGRNYSLFAILADVRNNYGFAGCDLGEKFIPILGTENPRRGLPEDTANFTRKESDTWGIDGHSHNWLTLRELQEYDWDQIATRRGWVNKEQYDEFVKNGKPESWSGDVIGDSVHHISNEEMAQRPVSVLENGGWYYTKIQWEEPYRDCVSYFLNTTIPALEELGDPDDVRIVFWFDN